MKFEKRNSSDGVSGAVASGGISAENYVDRARAFIRGKGGDGYIIRAIEGENGAAATSKPATEPQWIAWINYWASKSIPHENSVKRGFATVPTEWPEDFDYEASSSDRYACLPPKQTRVSGPRTITPRIRDNMMAIGSRRKDFELAALAEKKPTPNYSNDPVKFSEETLAAMRRRYPDAAE